MKRSNLKNVIAVIAAVLAVLFAFVACTVKEKTPGGDENAGENGGQVTPETIYLDSVTPGGSYLEYGKLSVNADADGNPLSLLSEGEEKEYAHGFMAHAYSDEVAADVDVSGVNRLALVADSLGGNGNDHAVWADCKLLTVNDKFDVYSLTKANSNVADIAPITSVTYTGTVNMSVAGSYPITVTAINSLGNRAVKECLISVCDTTEKLSSIVPVQSGNSNYAFREVSLYDGEEKTFSDGIYTKANGTLTLAFDV